MVAPPPLLNRFIPSADGTPVPSSPVGTPAQPGRASRALIQELVDLATVLYALTRPHGAAVLPVVPKPANRTVLDG